jgi:hypothetical protein
VYGPLNEVSRNGSAPSPFASQISVLPERFDWNATCVASFE